MILAQQIILSSGKSILVSSGFAKVKKRLQGPLVYRVNFDPALEGVQGMDYGGVDGRGVYIPTNEDIVYGVCNPKNVYLSGSGGLEAIETPGDDVEPSCLELVAGALVALRSKERNFNQPIKLIPER